jgi:hypothetical protein
LFNTTWCTESAEWLKRWVIEILQTVYALWNALDGNDGYYCHRLCLAKILCPEDIIEKALIQVIPFTPLHMRGIFSVDSIPDRAASHITLNPKNSIKLSENLRISKIN